MGSSLSVEKLVLRSEMLIRWQYNKDYLHDNTNVLLIISKKARQNNYLSDLWRGMASRKSHVCARE